MVHLYFVSRPRWDGAGDLDGKHGSDGGWADDDDDYGYQWLLYNGYIMAINDYWLLLMIIDDDDDDEEGQLMNWWFLYVVAMLNYDDGRAWNGFWKTLCYY